MGAPERTVVVLVDGDVAELVGHRVVDQQRPARGGRSGSLEFALPALVGAEVLGDAVGEVTVGFAAAVRAHVLPEHRVEIVPRAVMGHVVERTARRGVVAGLAVLREGLLGAFEAVHVALMVGVVMPLSTCSEMWGSSAS